MNTDPEGDSLASDEVEKAFSLLDSPTGSKQDQLQALEIIGLLHQKMPLFRIETNHVSALTNFALSVKTVVLIDSLTRLLPDLNSYLQFEILKHLLVNPSPKASTRARNYLTRMDAQDDFVKLLKGTYERNIVQTPNKKILIVNDLRLVLSALIMAVEEIPGIDILGAIDPQQAFEIFLAHRPFLIVLNYKMPRMNGVQLLKLIRQRCRELQIAIPIFIMVTSFVGDVEEECYREGCLEVMTYDSDMLRSFIRNMLKLEVRYSYQSTSDGH